MCLQRLIIWLLSVANKVISIKTITEYNNTIYVKLKKMYNYFYNNDEWLKDPFKGVKMPKKRDTKVIHLKWVGNVLEAVYLGYGPQGSMYVGILLAFMQG